MLFLELASVIVARACDPFGSTVTPLTTTSSTTSNETDCPVFAVAEFRVSDSRNFTDVPSSNVFGEGGTAGAVTIAGGTSVFDEDAIVCEKAGVNARAVTT